MNTHYDLIASNKRRSFFAIILFVGVICGFSYLLVWAEVAPLSVLAWSFILTGGWSFISYFFSDKIILAYSGAKLANRQDHFDFYTVTENLTLAAQIPLPKMYVMEDPALNAFATGRNPKNSVICVTTGLLARLNRHELEAVVAHELSHIRHYDILLSSLISILIGTLVMVIDIVLRSSHSYKNRDSKNNNALVMLIVYVLAILAPILLQIMKLALSRRREYYADAGSAELTQNPNALISVLEKISSDSHQVQRVSGATADLYIADPLKKKKGLMSKLNNLFSTHPPIDERIAALRALSQ